MIAARILGRKEVGLAAMLESELGIRLEKVPKSKLGNSSHSRRYAEICNS